MIEKDEFQPIPAVKFYVVILALAAVDLFIVSIWPLLDPMQRRSEEMPLDVSFPSTSRLNRDAYRAIINAI